MHNRSQAYVMDYDWVWSGLPRTSVATLRVTLEHSGVQCAGVQCPSASDFAALLDSYFQGLHAYDSADEHADEPADQPIRGGHGGRGGWAVHLRSALSTETQTVLDLISAGQDAADAMEDASQYTYEYFKDFPGIAFTWTQLPPERLDYTRD